MSGEDQSFNVVVVGAGPAGLMAAIAAAGQGARVLICERAARPGRKLLASGGGRCNVTNSLDVPAFSARFGETKKYVQKSLRAFGIDDILAFFAAASTPLSCADGMHYFPESNQSVQVLNALLDTARNRGVVLRRNSEIRSIEIEGGSVRGVKDANEFIASRSVVLACGGRSYPKLGGTPAGYRLAETCGHEVVTPVPALVGLVTKEAWPAECAGVTLENATVRIGTAGSAGSREDGSVLFTHRGLSGPAVLNLSGRVARILLEKPEVEMRLIPGAERDGGVWDRRLQDFTRSSGKRHLSNCLREYLPGKLADQLVIQAGAPSDCRAADLSRSVRHALSRILAEGIPLTAVSSEGWDEAMVTSGGVSFQNIDSKTLGSLKAAGLFFAGEILNCDGPCGGFNITWALSSGYCAGVAAAARVGSYRGT